VPPFGQSYSLLSLANNTCIKDNFTNISQRFLKLYKRKAHLHHYSEVDGMDMNLFSESLNSINDLIDNYKDLEKNNCLKEDGQIKNTIPRLNIIS
jgi:tubulin epsilon